MTRVSYGSNGRNLSGKTYVSAVRLQRVSHFLDRFEQVSGAEWRGVVHACTAASGVGVVVACKAAVAVLWLPVVVFLLVLVAVVRHLGRRLLLLSWHRLTGLGLSNVGLSLDGNRRTGGIRCRQSVPVQGASSGRAPVGRVEVRHCLLAESAVCQTVVDNLRVRLIFECVLVTAGRTLARLRVLQEQRVAVSLILGVIKLGLVEVSNLLHRRRLERLLLDVPGLLLVVVVVILVMVV